MRRAVFRARFGLGVLLGLAFALLPACKTKEPEARWVRAEIGAGNDQLLMDVTALSFQKCGFPVGSGIDPGHLVAVSGWHTSLQPFRGKGWREKCEVRYRKLGPRKYEAQIRVMREKNDDIVHPLNLTYAQWIPDEDDTVRARSVMQHVRSLLGTDVEIGEKR